MVDEAGVRTNFSESFMFESFVFVDRDLTLDVLYKDCRHGAMYLAVCNELLSDIESCVSETGTEWRLYDLTVIQENVHGFVRYLNRGKRALCVSDGGVLRMFQWREGDEKNRSTRTFVFFFCLLDQLLRFGVGHRFGWVTDYSMFTFRL